MNEKISDDDIQNIISRIPVKKMYDKTFLISGAGGFLPIYMVKTILQINKTIKKKATVYALVKNKKKFGKKIPDYLNDSSLKIIEQDVCNKICIDDKIDYIIHGASYASPKYYSVDPVGTLLPNIIGTNNLLDLAVHKKIKGFLLFSSGEIYGNISDKKIYETNFGTVNSLDVRSCYAESKRMAETMCIAWNKQFNVPTKIARIFHTYGPGMVQNDSRVQADFIFDVINNKNIKMRSNGKAERPFCYISDVISACFLILLKGKKSQAYNVSNPNGLISIKKLAEILVGLFPEKKLKVIQTKDLPSDRYLKSQIKKQNPDITKLRKLGWKPQVQIKEGFLRTIKSYRGDF